MGGLGCPIKGPLFRSRDRESLRMQSGLLCPAGDQVGGCEVILGMKTDTKEAVGRPRRPLLLTVPRVSGLIGVYVSPRPSSRHSSAMIEEDGSYGQPFVPSSSPSELTRPSMNTRKLAIRGP